MAKVGINGLGRIGRAAMKVILETPGLEFVGANDIAPLENIAYLIKYDTAYGRYDKSVEVEDGKLVIDGQAYPYFSERDPVNIPWDEVGADIVIESTGFFRTQEAAAKHIEAGAKTVVISAPGKSSETPTVVHGVNTEDGMTQIFSCASCTTNCIAPVVEVMHRRFGVIKAIMTTIHAYTSTQAVVDAPSKSDFRRGRAAAANFVPTSTGAAIATTKVVPELAGKFDGVAVRAPIPVGSIADIVFLLERDTTVEEVNQVFREEAATDRYKDVMAVSDEPLVSSDIVGDPHGSVVDLGMTNVVDGNLVKVM
ncbi:MAG: type I glyceraldehyde-3-phosphate dehydrogenase, partial [Anaerolineae bacterium]|nr:type I glyceraldehyde-3-phosphate dehydrogenase [Anaerolineae bacterium]